MIYRKNIFYITIISIISVLYISGIITGVLNRTKVTEYIFQTGLSKSEISPVNSNELDIPLPKPSLITTETSNIRLDLEKISINKFFIIYSKIYGNQSHTAYHLYLTNLNKKNINKDVIGQVYLKTSKDKIIKPVAQKLIIQDFPADQPLGWKVKLVAKLPYRTQRPTHKLILIYQNREYRLTDIYY